MPLTKRLIKGSTLSYQEMDTNLDELVGSVDSIAALKAYPTSGLVDDEPIYVKGYYAPRDEGGGKFNWDSSNLSTDVTADTQSGIYVAPNSDPTGASGAWVRDFSGSLNAKWFGAVAGSTSDQTGFFHAAFDAAKAAGIGEVIAGGTFRLSTDMYLRDTVKLTAYGENRSSLVLELNGCWVRTELIGNRNPACRDTGLTATVKSFTGTETKGLFLAGVQYSDFNVKVTGFSATNAIGIHCSSAQDPITSAWRYTTNNNFISIEVEDCYNGVLLSKDVSDPATFGANFNTFHAGYVNGYTGVGIHVEYGEANSFIATRATTSITGSTGWLVEDSVNSFIGTTADGSFGGTVPGTLNSFGFPHGRDGDLTSVGMRFNTGSNGCTVINPRGDAPYNRFDFDSQTTLDNITILGRVDFNWIPDGRLKGQVMQSDSAASPAFKTMTNSASSSTVAEFETDATTLPVVMRVLNNGAMEIGSGDSDAKFIAGNAVRGRFQGSNGAFRPEVDNTQTCGTAGSRWSEFFAGNGTINTSDEREKTTFEEITDKERNVAFDLKNLIGKFKFKDSEALKGEGNGRIHFGVGAQSVGDVFTKHGLNPHDYALFCFDEWDESVEIIDAVTSTDDLTGEEVVVEPERTVITPAGDRYGIRYEELLAFILAAL